MSSKKNETVPAKSEYQILPKITKPADVAELECKDLITLADELRRVIIDKVSNSGGHLAPGLGVVELTLALYKCFNMDKDQLVWDVGHQAYAHKILSGRLDRFHTLRQLNGISGFPRRSESPYDHFGVGHSSTSISAALGMAMARDLACDDDKNVVAVIGDGSMTAGMAYEGLNQAGGMGRKMVVILNDNEMSISPNVGALSNFLSRKLSHPLLQKFKTEVESFMKQIPRIGEDLAMYARRGEDSFKSFFTPGMLFEAFRFTYLGPIDGHNIEQLCDVFEQVKKIDKPVLVHILTKKGKGYDPAEKNPTYFHGVGKFQPETGLARKSKSGENYPSYTQIFGDTLCNLAAKDDKIVTITAAMPEGTGTDCFREKYPERFVDVGICEQHAVTFAAGLATQGYKPAVAIYSTFLQRAYDQVVHDVCLQNLDVKFFLDRGGLVGEDGATHHGVFDLTYLRHIPNMVLMAPKDESELGCMMTTAFATPGPVAIRYPRGMGVGAKVSKNPRKIALGKGEFVREAKNPSKAVAVVTLGSRVYPALEAAIELEKTSGLDVAVFNTRFVKPLPRKQLLDIAKDFKNMLIVEENASAGGFSSAVLELLNDNDALSGIKIKRLGLPDEFIEHGTQKELRAMIGIDKNGIKKAVRKMLK